MLNLNHVSDRTKVTVRAINIQQVYK